MEDELQASLEAIAKDLMVDVTLEPAGAGADREPTRPSRLRSAGAYHCSLAPVGAVDGASIVIACRAAPMAPAKSPSRAGTIGTASFERTPLGVRQFSSQWHEQGVAGERDAAAEDNDLGIEHVDQRGDAGRERAHRARPHAGRLRVTGLDRLDQVGGRSETPAGAPLDRAVPHRILEAARRPADAPAGRGG